MGLPNATSMLSTLPSGTRAIVSRGSTVASLAVRTAINQTSQSSGGGLVRFSRANVWTLAADFIPRVTIGDTLIVDGVTSVVADTMISIGNLIVRAQVILFENTLLVPVIINGKTGTGLASQQAFTSSLDMTERGTTTASIVVSAADFDVPKHGEPIVVNGLNAIVVTVDREVYGLHDISFIVSNPVE